MSRNNLPRATGPVAHVSNPGASVLARAINKGGDVGTMLREAIIDAQVHRDWKGVAAIENSLEREDDRTLARHLGNVGARALVVSRSDGGAFAKRIPEGFDYGLAWLICLVFVRTDGDPESGFEIAEEFYKDALAQGELGVDWGPAPLCLPPLAFGGPNRLYVTEAGLAGVIGAIQDRQAHSLEMLEAQIAASTLSAGDAHTIAYIVWGTVVTGSAAPLRDLFNEDVWCPGLDLAALSGALTSLLATATTKFEGDTFIHPQCLSANDAHDFARLMATEQEIHNIVDHVVKPRVGDRMEDAHVRITKLIPNSVPYLDQLLITFWGRANVLLQTYRMPRLGIPMEEFASRAAQMCRAWGIGNIQMVDLVEPIGANDAPGYAVDFRGQLVSPAIASIGDAASLVRKLEWIELDEEVDEAHQGARRLPAVHLVEKQGALAILGDHYTPDAWARIKQCLSSAGEPAARISEALRQTWTGDADDLAWLLDRYEGLMLPQRQIALATQFKLANGATVKVTPQLLALLAETDIGADCPAMYLQSGFDLMYITLRVPAEAHDEDDGDGLFIDGVLVQRWSDSEGQHLLLDAFLTCGDDVGEPDLLLGAFPMKFTLHEDSCLQDLRNQLPENDQDLMQVLDLYAGVMLYMNSRDARVVKKNDRSDASAVLGALNRKKRRKEHYVALNSAVDAIHVGPEESVTDAKMLLGEHGGTGRKPHYRRGFVRFGQRVGKGLTQTRPVFIHPVLVNAHKLIGSSADKKQYVVGE